MGKKKEPSFEIHFTTQTIGEIEDRLGKGLYKIIAEMIPQGVDLENVGEEGFSVDQIPDIKLSVLSVFVEKGARVSKEESYKLIDKFILEEGGDMNDLASWIMGKLTNSNFLSKPRKVRQSTQKK